MQYKTSIAIEAFADDIWEILTDADEWHEWNTTVTKVTGEIEPHEKISIYSKISPKRPFNVTVATFEKPNKMVWKGGMPLGLFTGIRVFTLTATDNGTTEFSMEETFSGPLLPLLKRMMPDLQPEFDEMAICLKRAAES